MHLRHDKESSFQVLSCSPGIFHDVESISKGQLHPFVAIAGRLELGKLAGSAKSATDIGTTATPTSHTF